LLLGQISGAASPVHAGRFRFHAILGHSGIALMQWYAQLSADYLRAAMQFFGAQIRHA